MKVTAFNGSPRMGGNTEYLLHKVLEPIERAGIETELVSMGVKNIRGCRACGVCLERKNQRCVQEEDMINDYMQKIIASDAIVLGSPSYFADMSSQMKAFIDRIGYISFANGGLLSRKIGAAVCAQRRGGGVNVVESINRMFLMSRMIVPGSTYWNFATGLKKGEVAADQEGQNNMQDLGETIVWLLQKLY